MTAKIYILQLAAEVPITVLEGDVERVLTAFGFIERSVTALHVEGERNCSPDGCGCCAGLDADVL